MRKIIYILFVFAFFSCSKTIIVLENPKCPCIEKRLKPFVKNHKSQNRFERLFEEAEKSFDSIYFK